MKYLLIISGILTFTFILAQVYIVSSSTKSDKIPFQLIKKFDGFEIRKYPELVVATTILPPGNYASNSRLGFKKIAAYIFGNNSDKSQIAMTSPVQMDLQKNSSMTFFMPPNLSISKLPKPVNNDVSVEMQASRTVAAIQFSGWASDDILQEKFAELKALLKQQNIEFIDNYNYLGYNPPFQLTNRKNEVIIEVKL